MEKLIILGVLAAMLIGPERLPAATRRLAEFIEIVRRGLTEAKARARESVGPEFDDIDWKAYDPRAYDPRRIMREAWTQDDNAVTARPVPPTVADPASGGSTSATTWSRTVRSDTGARESHSDTHREPQRVGDEDVSAA
ncbi:MAG TPA: Sec-independent protein translocase TatB [Microbacterium sp.]|uniref:Sec-independent protein translocase TatB n=1 Tax=Microbacterium sp. TaxID=51671 RepID=UPI002D12FAEE|nr:Sec-independent protein translocase TatB [Microbacterium sp.]HWI31395.1 Sec-independent protein translocase TatB [Microbacterium sp.]